MPRGRLLFPWNRKGKATLNEALDDQSTSPKLDRSLEQHAELNISQPYEVKRGVHITYDAQTKQFSIEPHWLAAMLEHIDDSEQQANPEAVVTALKYYMLSTKEMQNQSTKYISFVKKKSSVKRPSKDSESQDLPSNTSDSEDERRPLPSELSPVSSISSDESNSLKAVSFRGNNKKTEQEYYVELCELVSTDEPRRKYSIHNEIGSGVTGSVCIANVRGSVDTVVAIKKIILKDQPRLELLVSEIQVLKKCNHENLVNFIDSYLIDRECLWIVMEYLDGGTLTDLVTVFVLSERKIACVLTQTLKALQYLHNHRIIHRDIKSDNILLGTDGTVKLTDFGFCATLCEERNNRNTLVGTPYWMAPEVINHEQYDQKVDIWSIGILTLETLDGHPPYMNLEPIKAIFTIAKNGTPEIKKRDSISSQLLQLLISCLHVNPEDRPTSTELLQHSFLRTASPKCALITTIEQAKCRRAMKERGLQFVPPIGAQPVAHID